MIGPPGVMDLELHIQQLQILLAWLGILEFILCKQPKHK